MELNLRSSRGQEGTRPHAPFAEARTARPLQVLLLARHALLRSGLTQMLASQPDIEIAAQGADLDEALLGAPAPDLDVLLVAAAMRSDNLAAIAQTGADLGVPVLLVGDDPEADIRALAATGIAGYLLPDAAPDQIRAALQAVATGLLVSGVHPARDTTEENSRSTPLDDPLTDREMQVLQLVARGLPNKGIARRLNISEHTVKFHVGSILSKLGAASRTEAVTEAAHRGLLTL